MLPNLLIIGAAKSGTTSLHSYLDEHPEIAMARPKGGTSGAAGNDTAPKEMRFFWRDDWREHLDWYASHFETDAPIRGEATPAYSQHPYHAGVAARIHSVVPDAKLLYIVRDPIERLVAHYLQQRADGDRRSFAERMADLERPDHPLVCASRYAMQVDNYLRLFDPSQLMVIDHQDLRHDRSYTLRGIFRFLGVDEDFSSPSFYSERNPREDKRALTRVGAPLFNRLADPVGRRVAPERWAEARPAVHHALSRPIDERPVVEGPVRARLEAILRPDAERLRAITGKPFASWSV